MPSLTESVLFLQALAVHVDRLLALTGDQWDMFRQKLLQSLETLEQADDAELPLLVDEVVAAGLESGAVDLVRALYRQARDEANQLDYATRFVTMTDPTSGERREVEVKLSGSAQTKGWEASPGPPGPPPASREAAVESGHDLLAALYMVDAEMSMVPTPPAPEARYFNTFFTPPADDTVIPPDQPLVHDQSYTLYVDISPERKGLGEEDVPFPDRALEEYWEGQAELPLTVWAASRDFAVEPQAQTLRLPRQGASEGVRFGVRPLLERDWGYLQVGLYYQGHLLQSKRIEAMIVPVAGAPSHAGPRPVQTARLTFTAAAQLDPEDLARMPERMLTVEVEQDPRDDSLDFRFLDRTGGQELARYDTHLQPEALGGAIADLRAQLKLAVTGLPDQGLEGYEWRLEGDDALLSQWLPRLANAGRKLYRQLLPQNQGQPAAEDLGEQLQAALQPGVVIQVNPVYGTVTVPWALLYERQIKYVPGRTRLCPNYANCGPGCADCPDAGDPYVVCPYAFWGYQYAIEQLPCWVTGEAARLPVLVREISNDRPLRLNLNVWRDFSLWRDHRDKISAAGEVHLLVAEETLQMEQIWAEHGANLDVVYFYSHGGLDQNLGPYLALSDARIDSNFLEASELDWPHAPLVFLNGCATGDYGPESYVSLIDDFRAAGASGIVGTECPVPEMFAEAYATALFPRLFRGEALGRAMLTTRLEFLKEKKNPLGLVYTLYAAHEIALARKVAG